VAGRPDAAHLQKAFARQLLRFILRYPTHLSPLSQPERKLLAHLLSNALGMVTCQADLGAGQRQLANATWLQVDRRLGGDKAKEERERKVRWYKVAAHQLDLLEKEVARSQVVTDGRSANWVGELDRCVKSLGFKRTVLVLDVTKRSDQWLEHDIWPHLDGWNATGLQTLLFIPEEWTTSIHLEDNAVQLEQLSWQQRQLTDMIHWRYGQFIKPKPSIQNVTLSIEALFQPKAFEAIVKQSMVKNGQFNPRQWIVNWNKAVNQVGRRHLLR
jgi:hypothetical protein